jgi:hypothetical protein
VAKGKVLLARFKPGDNLPVYATGSNIVAGRFVTISGKNSKGAYVGAHTGAGLAASGVAETDAIAGQTDWRGGTNLTRRGSVARVECGAAITVGAAVKSDANGKAIPQGGTGVILGYLLGRNLTAGGNITADTQIGEIDLV